MDIIAAKKFVKENARPVDLAAYRVFFEEGRCRCTGGIPE